MLNFAIAKVCAAPTRLIPPISKLHQRRKFSGTTTARSISDDAPEIFRELPGAGGDPQRLWGVGVHDFVRLEARRGALNAQWAEVDLEKKLWTVPASRMKSDHEHKVPLSALALEVLDRQARIRTGDSIFYGRSGSPISYAAFATAPAG